jgi:hypothetical protein
MQIPWFFATTPAPQRPATPIRRLSFGSRLRAWYIDWAERSHHQMRGSRAFF